VTLKNIGVGIVTLTASGIDTFEDGSTSKLLGQFEFITIQTDSTLTKWNIMPSYIDIVTKSGAQLITGVKTMDNLIANSPVLNSPAVDDPTFTNYKGGVLIQVVKVSTSGATVEFLSIPSWVRKITMAFSNVTTSGGNGKPYIQWGDSTGFFAAGYLNTVASFSGVEDTSPNGQVGIAILNASGTSINGAAYCIGFQRTDTAYQWSAQGSTHQGAAATIEGSSFSGSSLMGNPLDRIRLNASGGTFSGGEISITYEG